MPPVPADAFARELRALPAADRTAFVAALYADDGWETTVDDDSVVAERDDERRRIRVVDPGRFGTPDVDGADVVVAARHRDAVERAVVDAGAAYVGPEALRERLLYGIDRETAIDLYERHVGEPLARDTPDREQDGSGTLSAISSALPAIGSRRMLAALAIVALVGVAATGPGFLEGEPEPAPVTVTDVAPGEESVGAIGAATPTPTPAPEVAPGLTVEGVESAPTLADAHVAGVENRSRVMEWELTSPFGQSTGAHILLNGTARIENASHYRYRTSLVRPEGNGTNVIVDERYAAGGESQFQQRSDANGSRFFRQPLAEAPATTIDDSVETYLYRYFVGAENTVVSCADDDDPDCPTYRVEITGDPPAAAGEDVEEYRALANVSEHGVIRSIRASYTLPDRDGDDEREQVTFELDYRFEPVNVDAPGWLDDAKNATANGTATDD